MTCPKKTASLRRLRPNRFKWICSRDVEKGRQRRSRRFVVLTYYEYAPRAKAPAALPVEGRVLARLGWAGQTTGLFEQPIGFFVYTLP